MKILTSTLQIDDATQLSEVELMAAIDQLTADKDSMVAQINNDQIGDLDWKRRIELALSNRKRSIHSLNKILARKKRERAYAHSREYAQVFMQVVKDNLDRPTYLSLIDKTREAMLADGQD